MINKVRLGDVGVIVTGNTPPVNMNEYYQSNDIMFYKPSDFSKGNIIHNKCAEKYISMTAKKCVRMLPEGAVMFTCIGTIGKIGLTVEDSCTNQQINSIIVNTEIAISKYVAYALLYLNHEIADKANAPVVPIINKKDFSNIEIPLPTIEEQKEIVAILDQSSRLVEKRKEQIELINKMVKDLFVDMFGSPLNNYNNLNIKTIRDLVDEVKYGTSEKSVDDGSKIYLRMNNITYDGYLCLDSVKYINIEEKDYEKYVVRKGDILFNRTNSKELVGKSCVFNQDVEMIIAGYIIRVRANLDISNPVYINEFLNSKPGKSKLFNMCKNIVGQANINAQEMQNIPIPVPPIEVQNEFAEKVAKIEKEKEKMKKSLAKYEILHESLMQRSFDY